MDGRATHGSFSERLVPDWLPLPSYCKPRRSEDNAILRVLVVFDHDATTSTLAVDKVGRLLESNASNSTKGDISLMIRLLCDQEVTSKKDIKSEECPWELFQSASSERRAYLSLTLLLKVVGKPFTEYPGPSKQSNGVFYWNIRYLEYS